MNNPSDFNLEKAREDTPGCEHVLHFNNAGASLMPKRVIEAMQDHLTLESEIGGYEAADQMHARIEQTYDAAAELIGADRDEIAIVENATRAWDMAFYSIRFKPGDVILTCMAEYASNFIPFLQISKRLGVEIRVIPNDEWDQVSINALKEMVDERVKLIAITHVPTNGGLVNPAEEIGKVARDAQILYLLDACQSVGQMKVNVDRIGCDMLSATGRKYLRGPRGTGFLYVRKTRLNELEPPFLDLHAADWTAKGQYVIRPDARRFENWETNYAGKIGLGVAIEYALEWGLDKIECRIVQLGENLRRKLSDIEGVKVYDLGKRRCGIVTFLMRDWEPADVLKSLRTQNVNVSVSSFSATRLDMEARNLTSLLRASIHYFNSEEEIDRFCALITSMVN
jgi:cysteine desulfurase / selenocysteine lyase